MKRDFLKNLGLEDDAIEKIIAENGKDITSLKTEIANLKEDLTVKDGVIETKNSKIKELESNDIEALKKAEYERGKTEGSAEVEKFKFDTALDGALREAKVKDSKTISGFIDREKLKFENGKIEGLEEQLEPLKESHEYLFEGDEKAPCFGGATNGKEPTAPNGVSEMRRIMGLEENKK